MPQVDVLWVFVAAIMGAILGTLAEGRHDRHYTPMMRRGPGGASATAAGPDAPVPTEEDEG